MNRRPLKLSWIGCFILAIAACSGHGATLSPPLGSTDRRLELRNVRPTVPGVPSAVGPLAAARMLVKTAPVRVRAATSTAPPTSLCIGQAGGPALKYKLASYDEFDNDAALNTSPRAIAGDANVRDATSPPSFGTTTTFADQYNFSAGQRANVALNTIDDSYYPSFTQIARWQQEYGAALYPSTIVLVPGVGLELNSYPVFDAATVLTAPYARGASTITVSSLTGIKKGYSLVIAGDPANGDPVNGQANPIPAVAKITGNVITLTTPYLASHDAQTVVGSVPMDVENAVATYTYPRNELGGLLDGGVYNSHALGYWQYVVQLPVQPTPGPNGGTAAGVWPANWTLCEGSCNVSGNNYYEMDTFEQFGNFLENNGTYARQTLQADGGYMGQSLGPGPVTRSQYDEETASSSLSSGFNTFAQIATATGVGFYFNNVPASPGILLNQVPAATNPNLPGVGPIMNMQTCTTSTSQCGGPTSAFAPAATMIEQSYRYYAPTTFKCGPPIDVPAIATPSPVPTTPPTAMGVVPAIVQSPVPDAVSTGGYIMLVEGGSATPANDDYLIGSVAGFGYQMPPNWTTLVSGGSQTIVYCHVGTATGECPAQPFTYFGVSNHGGIGHIREYSGLSGPPVPMSTSNPYYPDGLTSATFPSSLAVPSHNGLVQVMTAIESDASVDSTVTGIVDRLSGALTTTPTDQTFNVQGAIGDYSAFFSLYESNVLQDASYANAQPIVNDQQFTSSVPAGDTSADSAMIFLPGTTSLTVQQLQTLLTTKNQPAYAVVLSDLAGTQQPLDGSYVTNTPNNSPYVDFAAATGNATVTAAGLLSTLNALIANNQGSNPIEVNVAGQPYSLSMFLKAYPSQHLFVLSANQAI